MEQEHEPVLLREILESFQEIPLRIFVDGTLGAGGHAEGILTENPGINTFIGIDQDPVALDIARQRLNPWKDKTTFISGNFSNLDTYLDKLGISKIDGMLLDLGVSSMQLNRPEKGFSFSKEGPLDMRMDPSGDLTAAEIVNSWSEKELGRVFRQYGEEKRWRSAARAIVQARQYQPFETTLQLAQVLRPALGAGKKKGINPLTLTFQALRICVNRELEKIEEIIPKAISRLTEGGRLAIISFHSLEDRIVKNTFRYAASDKENTSGIAGVFLNKEPQVRILTRKPIIPNDAELEKNPRSRSAKLRIVEKL